MANPDPYGPVARAFMKAGVVTAATAVLSYIFIDGGRSVEMFGRPVPKAVALSLGMGSSTLAASYLVPKVLPFTAPASEPLGRLQRAFIEPLMVAATSVALESVISPESVRDTNSILGTVGFSLGATAGASYVEAALWPQAV